MAAKKVPPATTTDLTGDNLAILIGQLLATTEAASSGINSLSEESKANSRAVIAAATTLGLVEKTVYELVKVVKDGNGQESLVTQMKAVRVEINRLTESVNELRKELDTVKKDVDAAGTIKNQIVGGKMVIWVIIGGLAWLVTTGIALYDALYGKK